MRCNEFVDNLDEHLDGDLAAQDVRALEQHAGGCDGCAALLAERRALRRRLANLPLEAPSEGFLELALSKAIPPPRARKPWAASGPRIAALAAVLLIAVAMLQTPILSPSRDIPEIAITLHEVTPVNLRFAAEAGLADARISLQLPEGVELAGYPGRNSLSWRTDLKEGDNLLRLPLVGHLASSSRLRAELEHPTGSKSFELQITVN